MIILPYQSVTLHTFLSTSEVRHRIDNLVEMRKVMRLRTSRNHLPFEGNLDGLTFQIRRIIHYKNNVRPEIYGKIETDLDKTAVKLSFRIHILSLIIVALLILIFVAGSLVPLIADLNGDPSFSADYPFWFPLVFLLIFAAITIVMYHFDSAKSRKIIAEAIQAIPK